MDNEAKLLPQRSFADSKSPVSQTERFVSIATRKWDGAQSQDVQVPYKEVVVNPYYHREGKECCISELQDGDVSYTVEGVVG